MKYKPARGKCSSCKSPKVAFYEDGTGICRNCNRKFVWKKCSKCNAENIEFLDDGNGKCLSCGFFFVWKRCSSCGSSNIVFDTLGNGKCYACNAPFHLIKLFTGVPAPSKKESDIVAENINLSAQLKFSPEQLSIVVTLKCRSSYNLRNIILKLFSDVPCVNIDPKQHIIDILMPDKALTLPYTLNTSGTTQPIPLIYSIQYYDDVQQRNIQLTGNIKNVTLTLKGLKSMTIDEDTWRNITSNFQKIEKTYDNIPLAGKTLFELVTEIIRDFNMYIIPPKVTDDGKIFRGNSRAYARDEQGNTYCSLYEILGDRNQSKLIVKLYSNNEESIAALYYSLPKEIETRLPSPEMGLKVPEVRTEPIAETKKIERVVSLIESQNLQRGFTYLIQEPKCDKAYNIFRELSKNTAGLIISTVFPAKIKNVYKIENSEILWLTTTSGEGLNPNRLEFEIMRSIVNYFKTNKEGIFLLDGFETLALENKFTNVLKFIKKVNDIASMYAATVIVSINPKALDEKDMETLQKEFDKNIII